MAMNQAEMEKKFEEMAKKIESLTAALEAAKAGTPSAPRKRYYEKRPQKFYTVAPRFVDGRYVQASPEHPAVVIFKDSMKIAVKDDGTPEDGTLIPFTEKLTQAAPVKPFAESQRRPPDKASDRDMTEGSRPSDTNPAAR